MYFALNISSLLMRHHYLIIIKFTAIIFIVLKQRHLSNAAKLIHLEGEEQKNVA